MAKRIVKTSKRGLYASSGIRYVLAGAQEYNTAVAPVIRRRVVAKNGRLGSRIEQTHKIITAVDKIYNQETQDIERFARIYSKE
jgi:hypothetical protein